jgi:hypothetical protein
VAFQGIHRRKKKTLDDACLRVHPGVVPADVGSGKVGVTEILGQIPILLFSNRLGEMLEKDGPPQSKLVNVRDGDTASGL